MSNQGESGLAVVPPPEEDKLPKLLSQIQDQYRSIVAETRRVQRQNPTAVTLAQLHQEVGQTAFAMIQEQGELLEALAKEVIKHRTWAYDAHNEHADDLEELFAELSGGAPQLTKADHDLFGAGAEALELFAERQLAHDTTLDPAARQKVAEALEIAKAMQARLKEITVLDDDDDAEDAGDEAGEGEEDDDDEHA